MALKDNCSRSFFPEAIKSNNSLRNRHATPLHARKLDLQQPYLNLITVEQLKGQDSCAEQVIR